MRATKRQEITNKEYLQLLGLKLIADQHLEAMQDVQKAIRSITKEEDDCGHSSDVVWDKDTSIDEMLTKLDLKVVD